jgi:FKBP-type peptidyl-prolyl cis-trans isomerase FklB
MKKLVLFVTLITTINLLNAQPAKTITVKPAVAKPVSVLKNINDSASYAIGVSVANFYKQQGIKNLNTTLVSKAINDIMGGKKSLLDDAAANACMNTYMTRIQSEKSKPTIEAGQKFLAQNKLKPGIKVTASGLQYEVITQGTGIKPTAIDTFVAHYRGTYIDGTEFDASYNRGQPLNMALSQVIPGWTEGLQLMQVGSKYKFYIPYNLAYGAFDYNGIPGGSMLIFDLELLDVKKKQ